MLFDCCYKEGCWIFVKYIVFCQIFSIYRLWYVFIQKLQPLLNRITFSRWFLKKGELLVNVGTIFTLGLYTACATNCGFLLRNSFFSAKPHEMLVTLFSIIWIVLSDSKGHGGNFHLLFFYSGMLRNASLGFSELHMASDEVSVDHQTQRHLCLTHYPLFFVWYYVCIYRRR